MPKLNGLGVINVLDGFIVCVNQDDSFICDFCK